MVRSAIVLAGVVLGIAAPLRAADAGTATGSATIDGITTPLRYATEARKENLFDEKKQDIVIVLSDKTLGATRPDDEIELSLRARRGELMAIAVRLDANKPVNVTVSHKSLNGLVILPGNWFQYTTLGATAGVLKLEARDFQGHSFAFDVAFSVGASRPPLRAPSPPPALQGRQ